MNTSITAHSGCMGTEPNSVESIIQGFKTGADITEIDVRFNKDGTPVLSHDKVNEASEYITLSDAFDCIKNFPDKKVNLDIKETTDMQLILKLAAEKGVINQLFFTGINVKDTHTVKKYCPDIPYYLNFGKKSLLASNTLFIKYLIKLTKSVGAIGINLNKCNCNKNLVKMFKKADLLVSVWTVNDVDEAVKFANMDVDNITTKSPDTIISALEKIV